MISPRELRLGNILMFGEIYMSVYLISDEEVRCKSIVDDYDLWTKDVASTLSPVPLTEEILVKCGFISNGRYSDNDYSMFRYPHYDEFYLQKDYRKLNSGWNPYIDSSSLMEGDSLFSFGEEVKYLHQLQNLIFALTGKELNVQL